MVGSLRTPTKIGPFENKKDLEDKYIDSIIKYREYILRASGHSIQSLRDILEIEDFSNAQLMNCSPKRQLDEGFLKGFVDSFFKDAQKYTAGLLGGERFSELLGEAGKIMYQINPELKEVNAEA